MSSKPTKTKATKPAKTKTAKAAPSKTPRPATRTVIMFGLDKERKPHAARFTGENDALLAKAATVMGMRLAVPVTRKHFEVVGKLPVGKIHATGNGLVPSVDQKQYEQIISLVGGEPGVISHALPKSWTELVPGQLVLAHWGIEDGWFEAVISKKATDSVTLRWRDYPSEPEFVRPIGALALLHPQQ